MVPASSPALRDVGPRASRVRHQHAFPASDFIWEPGNLAGGTARSTATCPANWTMVAGGAYFNEVGADQNPGAPDISTNSWTAPAPLAGVTERAYVSCVAPAIAHYFKWVSENLTYQGHFGAQCPSGYSEIAGYSNNTPQWAVWNGAPQNTYWAYTNDKNLEVSCGSNDVIETTIQTVGNTTGDLLTSCPSDSVLVGGSTGDFDDPGWPRMAYPNPLNTSSGFRPTSWYTFTGVSVIKNTVACAPQDA
jgi:hypothetical protein